MLENQLNLGSDRTELLEIQLKEARALANESDRKYDEVARKLIIQEHELEKAEERAKRSEMFVGNIWIIDRIIKATIIFHFSKCAELENEMKNLHHQLKSSLARIDDVRKIQLIVRQLNIFLRLRLKIENKCTKINCVDLLNISKT